MGLRPTAARGVLPRRLPGLRGILVSVCAASIEVVLDARACIGESPTWSAREQVLYWIDVKQPALHRFDPRGGTARTWGLPSDVGAFALCEAGSGAVVALRDGIFTLDFRSGDLERLAPPPFDRSLFRFNEGACDATGRFWVGVMFDPLHAAAGKPQRGSLHSFTLRGGLRAEPDAAELHNGMAWSPDGISFYIAHSYEHEVLRYEFDSGAGTLGRCERFTRVPEHLGVPDGAATDTEGGYWCALHGAGRLRRYGPDGRLDAEILLPVSQPTMCAFAGEALDVMYVTSARDKLSPEQLAAEPLAGALLRLRPGKCGIARRCTVA